MIVGNVPVNERRAESLDANGDHISDMTAIYSSERISWLNEFDEFITPSRSTVLLDGGEIVYGWNIANGHC